MTERPIWFVNIVIPTELMNEIKDGSIDLADQDIDLQELNDAYEDDLDQEGTQDDSAEGGASPDSGMGGPAPQQSAQPPVA
jgi:hypothetical protein